MPGEPLFNSDERVPRTSTTGSTDLPAELRGVTDPVKVAQYYQEREARLREELRRNNTNVNANSNSNTSVTMTRPTETPTPATPISLEEATSARETLIAAARQQASVGKQYWDRLADQIEQAMAGCSPEDKVNYKVWEVAYHTMVGMNKSRLDTEDAAAAAERTRIATERSTTNPEATPPPTPLDAKVISSVLPGLGITEEMYRKGQERIAKGEWPLTMNNVDRR